MHSCTLVLLAQFLTCCSCIALSSAHQMEEHIVCFLISGEASPFWLISSPRHDQFPHRWWPTDTGPPEGSPGAARDGAARRQGAWGGCSPGGGAHAIKSCVICACARTFWGVCLSHHASKYRKIYFRTIFSRLAPSEHVPTSPTSP